VPRENPAVRASVLDEPNRTEEVENATDDVRDVEAVGEPPRWHVSREVDPVRRRVRARRGHEVVVVAVVDEGVAEHEEGARRRGRRRSGERCHRGGNDDGQGHEPQNVHGWCACGEQGLCSLDHGVDRVVDYTGAGGTGELMGERTGPERWRGGVSLIAGAAPSVGGSSTRARAELRREGSGRGTVGAIALLGGGALARSAQGPPRKGLGGALSVRSHEQITRKQLASASPEGMRDGTVVGS
jgi:hypothetical protein